MTMGTIIASVGLGGENRRQDVIAVQSMLQSAGIAPGPIDGRCGRLTIDAIERFQLGIMRYPDGRVDVRGPTIRRLSARSRAIENPSVMSSGRTRGKAPQSPMHSAATSSKPANSAHAGPAIQPAQSSIAYWRERTRLPDPSINAGLICPSSTQMMQLLGDPNSSHVKSLMATESVGPFRATGLKPALTSLRKVLVDVGRQHPDLYRILGSNGMHVIRQTRKSQSYSNHAWGIAIDILIGGKSPSYGDNFSFRGLDVLVPLFHKAGWYWGGGYRSMSRKDAMHFECGLALVRSFQL